jgi:dihydroorotate dehydrogenase electron transfer subunit
MITGARTQAQLLYRERTAAMGLNTIFTTDDGSFGQKGTTADALTKILSDKKIETVYVCGPELMEKRIAEICQDFKASAQISVERQMKCGFGVCGACCLDDSGKRSCVEGTVFSGEEILKTKEFGKYHRDSSATKHPFGKKPVAP